LVIVNGIDRIGSGKCGPTSSVVRPCALLSRYGGRPRPSCP